MDEAPLEAAVVDEVLEAAAQLTAVVDSGRAEAWASGVLGLWREPGDHLDPLSADRQLLGELRRRPSPESLALAVAIAAIAPSATRSAALEAAEELVGKGIVPPPWADALGTARPVRAWRIETGTGPQRTVILEFASADGLHTVLAELDSGRLVDLILGPPGEELLAGLEEPGAEPIEPQPVDVEAAGTEIVAAWQASIAEGLAPSESWIMNRVVALRRLEWFADVTGLAEAGWPEPPSTSEQGGTLEDDAAAAAERDAEEAALAVLRAALGGLPEPDPAEVARAAAELRAHIDAGGWPAEALVASGEPMTDLDDADLLVVAAAACPARRSLPLSEAEAEALGALEAADWLGAVLGLVRGGPGTRLTPGLLVDNVNRCPDVPTSIPKRDRDFFEGAFALVLEAWRFYGFVDESGALTEVGRWAIPTGLASAWSNRSAGSGRRR